MAVRPVSISSVPASLIQSLVRPTQPAFCCLQHQHQQQQRNLRTKPINAKKPVLDKQGKPVITKTIESMPFQAYQLALEVIREDRAEKRQQIIKTQQRLSKALAAPGVDPKARHIISLKAYLEKLRILADSNNPRVKYNFDNGIIGLNKPIYRFLLDRKWRSFARPILMQRLTQMRVIPDVLPYIDPVVDVQVRFRGRDVKPGTILPTIRTESPPTVKIIPFSVHYDNMLCTIAVVDPDVPDVNRDSFMYRLHWLVTNIPITLTQTQAIGYPAPKNQSSEIVPYLPPHVQKGIPYHRYGLFVFRQSSHIDPTIAKQSLIGKNGELRRDNFVLRSFQDKNSLEPIGAFMWRNEWDDTTKEVMGRAGLEGADVMWQRVKA